MINQNKPQVLQYLLQLIKKKDAELVAKGIATFSLSKATIYNYLKELVAANMIEKSDKNPSGYVLRCQKRKISFLTSTKLEEDRIYDLHIRQSLANFPQNVQIAWRYAFTEMMNNAIEHSNAENIVCLIQQTALDTTISIMDDGMGIFKNIQDYVFQSSGETLPLEECASVLLAGKFTTAKANHSGEGIFFTSHLMDDFAICSDSILFTRNVLEDKQYDFPKIKKGTLVYMRLSNQSKKNLSEVFDFFSDMDEGFFKTQIPLAHVFPSGFPVSRSEARRLCNMISRFKVALLDFTSVEDIGQAFAHELFVVWQKNEPDIKLEIINASERVQKMIQRVKNTVS